MLAQFSVKKPFTIVVAIIIIAILGVVSLTNMSTDLLPSINLPYAVVATTYAGASPEQVEMIVTKPIEQRMASISNIKNVSSASREHMSMVILEFAESTNMDSAIIEMRESLDMIKGMMPEEISNPIILKLNPAMMPVMVVSASVEGQKISESSSFIENNLIPELEGVEGIASVSTSGLVENQIHVILQDEKMDEVNKNIQETILLSMQAAMLAGEGIPADMDNVDPDAQTKMPSGQPTAEQVPSIKLTREMVSGILKGQNFSMPAGYITEENVDYLVRTGDKITDLEELKKLPVMTLPIQGMDPILLEDVADIIEIDNSDEMYSKINGEDAAILSIQKQAEYSTADVAKNIRARIDSIMANNEGVEIVPLMDQGEYVDIVVNSIGQNLIFGGFLAILILLLFLRDIKPTIVVGFAIPISLVTALVMMYFSKISLNVISMGGLALGVGMLVDNSIVVIENIYRMRIEGKSAKEAAVEGAKQVSGAISASTLTTIAVFLPILFTQGLTRQIFADMGLTIAFSLIASLVIALTLVPMMASNILVRNVKKDHRVLESIKGGYSNLLRFSLRHKWIVAVVTLGLFAGSIFGVLNMGTELFPTSDMGQLTVDISMPKGSVFEETTQMADEVVGIISEIDEVETVGATISGGMMAMVGGMGGGSSSEDSVSAYVLLKDDKAISSSEVAQIIRDRTKDLNAQVSVNESNMDMAALSGQAIALNIKGREFDTLEKTAKDIAEIIAEVEGTVQVSDGIEKTSPELRIVVDKEKSIANGLTVAQVFMEVSDILKADGAATSLSIGAKDFDIFVKDAESEKELSREDIGNLLINTPQGQMVAVKDIALIEEAEGFSSINRVNQQRYVTVSAEIADGYNIGKVSEQINKKIDEYDLPEGYFVDMGGENKMMMDSFRDLFLMLVLAVAFIYLIMVAQFQSLLSPFIVMFTVPLAFTGAFFGLLIAGMPVSIIAFVGLIVLSGVVVNNGIVFVDYVNVLRRSGMDKKEAIIKAGNDRMRPIFMTALTTILALSTMSVGMGKGTEMMQPMAVATIGGLLYATLLTLVLIPVLYDLFNRKERLKVE